MSRLYDHVAYPDFAFADQHPFYLLARAELAGCSALTPTTQAPATLALEGFSVLEVGSAGGANLVFMAETAPQCRFLGVELSSQQAELAQRRITEARVNNAEVFHGSFEQLPASKGPFDLVLCHGLLSWLSPQKQETLLDVVLRALKPGGLLYLSYNAMPGWEFKGYVRHFLRFLVPSTLSPSDQLTKLTEVLPTLRDLVSPLNPARSWILPLLERLEQSDPAYLFHEYLSEWNQAFFVEEITAKIAMRGGTYLGESDPAAHSLLDCSPQSKAFLEHAALDTSKQEQLLDFMRCPAFRRSLFVRSTTLAPGASNKPLALTTHFGLAAGISVTHVAGERFELSKPQAVSLALSGEPAACLQVLAQAHPGCITGSELARRSGVSASTTQAIVSELVRSGYVTPWKFPLPVLSDLTNARPALLRLTKILAQSSNSTITARGERVLLTDSQKSWLLSSDLASLPPEAKSELLREGFFTSALGA